MNESDGIEESVEGVVRVAVTAGAQLGSRLAQLLREQWERARQAELHEAGAERARFEAERQSAGYELRQIQTQEWWREASPERIGHGYATARAWEEFEPSAKAAQERISVELKDRYGIDVDRLDADPMRVQEAVARMEAERFESAAITERQAAAADRADAAATLTVADSLDRDADAAEAAAKLETDPVEQERQEQQADQSRDYASTERKDSELSYDSAERRDSRASQLERDGISERVAETHMRADASQGRPAREAVQTRKAAKARKGRVNMQGGKQAQLGR